MPLIDIFRAVTRAMGNRNGERVEEEIKRRPEENTSENNIMEEDSESSPRRSDDERKRKDRSRSGSVSDNEMRRPIQEGEGDAFQATSSATHSTSHRKRASLHGISVHGLSISSPTRSTSQASTDSTASKHDSDTSQGQYLGQPHFNITPATPVTPNEDHRLALIKGHQQRQVGKERHAQPESGSDERMDSQDPEDTKEADDKHQGTSSSSVAPPNKPMRQNSIPKRGLLQRLPSQVISDTPSTEGSFTPASDAHTPALPSAAEAAPQGMLATAAKQAARDRDGSQGRSDYKFPTMLDSGGLTEEPIAEEDAEPLNISKAGSHDSTQDRSTQPSSSLSPAKFPGQPHSPRIRTSRQDSTSSVSSVNEYSTPQGFLKHRRNSSAHAPREVKETTNAGYQDLPDGKRKLNQYVLTSDIGRGSFGVVQLAKDENTGREYAVKEFSKIRLRKRKQSEMIRRQGRTGGRGARRGAVPFRRPPPGAGRGADASPGKMSPGDGEEGASDQGQSDLDLIRSEMAIMKKLDHPNVVKLYEVLDVQEDDSLFMVVELCASGPLMAIGMGTHSDPMSEDDARNYFRQIVLAIEYLHHVGIIHRDIKPENILKMSDDKVVKLVDFGVSEMFSKDSEDAKEGSDKRELKTGGSPAFSSPELCISHAGAVSGKAVDIWALGITLYCMVVGHLPFEATQMLDLFEQIKNDPVKIPKELSPQLKGLLGKLLDKDPETRIKMPDLKEHPWMTCDGQDPLPSTEQNVTSLPDVTDDDLAAAIAVPSVSYIVNAVRAASRWKRFAARRSRSDGQESRSSMDSSEMSRSGSVDYGGSHLGTSMNPAYNKGDLARSRNASLDSYGTSLTTDISGGSSIGRHNSDDSAGKQHEQGSQVPDLPPAATFPMSTIRNEKDLLKTNSAQPRVDFPGIDTLANHHQKLSCGIDDSSLEAVRFYEDQTGHLLPRDAVTSSANASANASRAASRITSPDPMPE